MKHLIPPSRSTLPTEGRRSRLKNTIKLGAGAATVGVMMSFTPMASGSALEALTDSAQGHYCELGCCCGCGVTMHQAFLVDGNMLNANMANMTNMANNPNLVNIDVNVADGIGNMGNNGFVMPSNNQMSFNCGNANVNITLSGRFRPLDNCTGLQFAHNSMAPYTRNMACIEAPMEQIHAMHHSNCVKAITDKVAQDHAAYLTQTFQEPEISPLALRQYFNEKPMVCVNDIQLGSLMSRAPNIFAATSGMQNMADGNMIANFSALSPEALVIISTPQSSQRYWLMPLSEFRAAAFMAPSNQFIMQGQVQQQPSTDMVNGATRILKTMQAFNHVNPTKRLVRPMLWMPAHMAQQLRLLRGGKSSSSSSSSSSSGDEANSDGSVTLTVEEKSYYYDGSPSDSSMDSYDGDSSSGSSGRGHGRRHK